MSGLLAKAVVLDLPTLNTFRWIVVAFFSLLALWFVYILVVFWIQDRARTSLRKRF